MTSPDVAFAVYTLAFVVFAPVAFVAIGMTAAIIGASVQVAKYFVSRRTVRS